MAQMPKIILNPSNPRRAKLHMEAVWNALVGQLLPGHIQSYSFRDYTVQVRHSPCGGEMLTLEFPK
jgi:hypothetical protein